METRTSRRLNADTAFVNQRVKLRQGRRWYPATILQIGTGFGGVIPTACILMDDIRRGMSWSGTRNECLGSLLPLD
jgi:hypothetical protein